VKKNKPKENKPEHPKELDKLIQKMNSVHKRLVEAVAAIGGYKRKMQQGVNDSDRLFYLMRIMVTKKKSERILRMKRTLLNCATASHKSSYEVDIFKDIITLGIKEEIKRVNDAIAESGCSDVIQHEFLSDRLNLLHFGMTIKDGKIVS